MKNLIGKILILSMVMSPMAAASVTLTLVPNGDDLDLHYENTDANVVGIAVTVTTNNTLTAVTTSPDMLVHIDAIHDEVAPVLDSDGVLAGSSGLAKVDGPGVASGTAGTPFSISLATLSGVLPASGTLATFSGPDTTEVCITADSLRSAEGAVDSVTGSVTVVLPGSCANISHSTACAHSCWTNANQCQGDADGDNDVDADDFTLWKDIFTGVNSYDACSDFDRDGDVDADDFTLWKDTFTGVTPVAGACTCL